MSQTGPSALQQLKHKRRRWQRMLRQSTTIRTYLHLPIYADTRTRGWVKFPTKSRIKAIREIKKYFGERFTGLTHDIWNRENTHGEWRGKIEKYEMYFMDLPLLLEDFEWLHNKKSEWEDDFDQHEIFLKHHPIWN
jgi:hypothetical protein